MIVLVHRASATHIHAASAKSTSGAAQLSLRRVEDTAQTSGLVTAPFVAVKLKCGTVVSTGSLGWGWERPIYVPRMTLLQPPTAYKYGLHVAIIALIFGD